MKYFKNQKLVTFAELLDRFFKKYNYNPHSFSKRFGGTDVTYRDILSGETKNVSYKIKSNIERAFNILINDDDPENITYVPNDSTKYIPLDEVESHTPENKLLYKIEGQVPAGINEVIEYSDWQESEDLYFDPRTHFYLRVDHEFGYSMMPLISPGDLVLCSTKVGQANNGDIVAARWDKTKGALKILTINPDIPNMYVLTSYNQAVPPIFVNKKDAHLYKVVLIKKKK